METIAWIGVSQSIFAAILIGTKKNNSISDRILTGWLSLLAIDFFTCAIDYKIFNHPLLSNSFLLFNPAFYLYTKSLTQRKFKLRWIQILHLLPYVIFKIFVYILKEPFSLSSFIESGGNFTFRILFGIVSFLSWIIYSLASSLLVKSHRKNLENEFSSIESNIKINWILFIVSFYISFCIISLGLGIYALIREINLFLSSFNYSVLLLLVFVLSYYGSMQKEIFARTMEEELPEKYKKSSLTSNKKKEIKSLVLNYFSEGKPYLNAELNMDLLSKQLNVPKHQLSEVLSTELGKNFFQFVNSYRVEAVKEQLADTRNPFSIEAIGYECGFSSKSSFFTVFKRLTGQTPLQYKESSIH
jgi:AraC-like DNA-binding protein